MSEQSFSRLLAPIALRGKTLRNRIVFGAHTANMAVDGLPTERHAAYYAERGSHGPGAGKPEGRASVTRQLTAEEAKAWSKEALLSSPDGWAPWEIKF